MAAPNKKHDRPTTGHQWDGIEEFDNPLPRWWLWIFYATIIWSVVYWILFPAWPLISGATAGVLGYSSRADVAAEIQAVDAANQEWYQRLVDTDPAAIAEDPELQRFAVNAGGRCSAPSARNATGPGRTGCVPVRVFPTCSTTNGCGAARWMTS